MEANDINSKYLEIYISRSKKLGSRCLVHIKRTCNVREGRAIEIYNFGVASGLLLPTGQEPYSHEVNNDRGSVQG